ncbi:MAG: alpha/beta fold hydrolase, partial [Dehalococcoidia bacterium]
WAPLAAKLPGFRCLLLDRPGCGLSEPLPKSFHGFEGMARVGDDLCASVLDAAGIDRAALVGTSFGGYFVLRAAVAHADRIERVLEFGYPIGAPPSRVPLIMRTGGLPGGARMSRLAPMNERGIRSVLRQIGLGRAVAEGKMGPVEIAWFLSLMRDTDTMANELRANGAFFRLRGDLHPSVLLAGALLRSIAVPVRFLWGEEDPFGTEAVARAFTAQIPGATLEMIPRAGHAVWMDDAELAARETVAFLGG